jgi:hypothetical protein
MMCAAGVSVFCAGGPGEVHADRHVRMGTSWLRAIDPAVSGLRAERTSRLPLGDGQRRFAVLEIGDPRVGYTSKIAQRFAGEREPG